MSKKSIKPQVGQIWKHQFTGDLCLVLILNVFRERCLCLVDTVEPELVGAETNEYALFEDYMNSDSQWELFLDVK